MTHKILPGSLEVHAGVVTAGVHTGPDDFTVKNLRYVSAEIPANPAPGTSVASFLGEVYDNSEGCMVAGGFKMKEPKA